MAEETLHSTPYGWWEKAYVVGLFIVLAVAVAAVATVALFLKWVDSWTYLAIAVASSSSA